MNKLKRGGFFSLVGLMGILLLWAIGAEASTSRSDREQSRINEIREELKALEKQDTIMLEGTRTALYREYKNPSEALQRLKESVPETLKRLQEQSTERLEELSAQNWKKYELLAIPYETSWDIDQERWEEVIIILQFFDIYENTIQNNQIQPKGVKTRFVKKTIKLIAKVLRNTSDDVLKKVLKKRVRPEVVAEIISTKYEIADILDDILLPLDYASSQIQTAIYDAMVPYVGHWIAWGVSGLIELIAL